MTRNEFALKIQLPLKPLFDVVSTIMDATTDKEFESAGCEITVIKGVKRGTDCVRVEYKLECSLQPPTFLEVMNCLRNDVDLADLESIDMEVCTYRRNYPELPAVEEILTYGPTCNFFEQKATIKTLKKN